MDSTQNTTGPAGQNPPQPTSSEITHTHSRGIFPWRTHSREPIEAVNPEHHLSHLHHPENPELDGPDDDQLESSGSSAKDFEKDLEKGEKTETETGVQKGKEAEKVEVDPNLVVWTGPDDPENPMNYPTWRKWMITVALGSMTLCITFASSVFSTATFVTAEEFGVSNEVMTLGTSLFVLGFAIGPPIFGPFSEIFGRKVPLFTGFFIFALFNFPVAVAQNIETIMLMRFFGGAFGSSPLAIVGGILADLFEPVDRGVALCVFASATFIGPITGPIVGGFITQSYLGWRWTAYIAGIMGFFFGTIGFILVPETFGPRILQIRARDLKYKTKNWALHSKLDETEIDFRTIARVYLLRAFQMLFLEPILLLISLYISLIYGIMYLFFEAYPIAFQEQRGWNQGVGALPFIGLAIGVLIGCAIITYATKTRFARKLKKHGRVIPEERLPPMILGAFCLPVGLFWFAWTSSPHITWVPQTLAGIPIGCGVMMIFLQGLSYIIDVYKMHANSAIAGNSFMRAFFAAGFPLFAVAMFDNLGVAWATSLLSFLCVALIPVPILFYVYGKKLRSLSRFSPD